MNRLQRAAVLTDLAGQMRRRGSWCGETHLQKATYFLQDLLDVPLGFSFILYRHGPFSFDLSDELTALRADGLFELHPRPVPYGPSLLPTPRSEAFRERYPVTLGRFGKQVTFVAESLASKGVADLERLATAFYIFQESAGFTEPEDRALRLHELKPHVQLELARAAVAEVDQIIQQARQSLDV